MRAKDGATNSHRLPGIYQKLLDLERDNIDPRAIYGKHPDAVRLARLNGPRARPPRLRRLERGKPTLVPRWWVGGNYFPRAANWEDYDDRSIEGWLVSENDTLVPVGANDPRWAEPGNRL